MSMFARACRVIAVISVTLIVAGCSSAQRQEDRMKDAFQTLMKRPDIVQVDDSYLSMFQTIRERLTAEVGLAVWELDDDPVSETACAGGISNLDDARKRNYNAGRSPGQLSEAQWQQALAIVTAVTARHGYGAMEVRVSGRGDHEVEFFNTYRGNLLFASYKSTVLGGFSACHLARDAHQRGTYRPRKVY